MPLEPRERLYLLQLARDTIAAALSGRKAEPRVPPFEGLREPRGAFVTLHRHGQLRGCIGTFEARAPLYEVVREMALAAAFNDPRFPPLSAEELPEVEIEISVLSPLRRGRPEEVEVGRHGVYVVKGAYRGVLLPQVAVEHGWDRETFLDHVCLKAGLPPRCWQDPETELYLFTAEIFSEKDFRVGA